MGVKKTMNTLYMLVGVPGSGKSTWIESQNWSRNCVHLSSDKFIEEYAFSVGKTYNEVFDEYVKTATQLLTKRAITTNVSETDAIWDQTNLTVKSRSSKLKLFPCYRKIAVVFSTPDTAELARRLASRPGKSISDAVIASMTSIFQMPSEEEGFDEIWHV
jgi:predicted kinase